MIFGPIGSRRLGDPFKAQSSSETIRFRLDGPNTQSRVSHSTRQAKSKGVDEERFSKSPGAIGDKGSGVPNKGRSKGGGACKEPERASLPTPLVPA